MQFRNEEWFVEDDTVISVVAGSHGLREEIPMGEMLGTVTYKGKKYYRTPLYVAGLKRFNIGLFREVFDFAYETQLERNKRFVIYTGKYVFSQDRVRRTFAQARKADGLRVLIEANLRGKEIVCFEKDADFGPLPPEFLPRR